MGKKRPNWENPPGLETENRFFDGLGKGPASPGPHTPLAIDKKGRDS
jgi:hypothetical protein